MPLLLLTGCFNIYAPFDSPGGDAQLVSAARAALDRGDFATAAQDYGKLSSSNVDIEYSEGAYGVLDQYGVGFGAFGSAFGSTGGGGTGKSITSLANAAAGSSGTTARGAFLQAYQNAAKITDNGKLKGLVEFLTGMALFSDLLAEVSATPGHVVGNDIVSNATSCATLDSTTCAGSSACDIGNPALADGSAGTPVSMATASSLSGGVTLSMLQTALDGVNQGLTDLQSSGSLGSSLSGFTNSGKLGDTAIQTGGTAALRCYRWTLVNLGIGSY
jgi:hypothetical protein